MSAFWITLFLLLLAACTLFLAAGWRQRQASTGDRDRLNQRFYHQRIDELAQDEDQGVVAERPLMERDDPSVGLAAQDTPAAPASSR